MSENDPTKLSAFHRGELEVQKRAGISDSRSTLAAKAVKDHIPENYQLFFSLLPMLFVAGEDQNNDLWSTVLTGSPGFIEFESEKRFHIHSQFLEVDPLVGAVTEGSELGLLGIEFSKSRLRNRVNVSVNEIKDSKICLDVKQSYGNCPKYIQMRQGRVSHVKEAAESIPFDRLNTEITDFIHQADTLFIASKYIENKDHTNNGIDSSHRGGVSGFTRVADETTILIPDYIGNGFFNTMGNILLNPKVGLQYVDYKNGHRYLMTGTAEVIWAEDAELPFDGVDRMIKFSLKKGFLLKNSIPYVWDFKGYSPFSLAYAGRDFDM